MGRRTRACTGRGERLLLPFLFFLILMAACQSRSEPKAADFDLKAASSATGPLYLGEPPQNAGTLVKYADGSVKYYYREGSWDYGGFSSMVVAITTRDGGDSWSQPEPICDTGPHSRAQNFLTLSPVSGELIVFYFDKEMNIWRVRSRNRQTDWSDNRQLNTFRHAGICYGHCIWIDLPGGGKRVLCGYHGSGGTGAGTYYSDDDGITWQSSNRVRVPDLIPNIWHTGAVEPTMLQLADGRIWMLLRNSNDHLYESFSYDMGESWIEPRPSRFYSGPNSWATLKRLSSGLILLAWNNAMPLDPMATQDKWSFSNRDVIHLAASPDEGNSWFGFRELMLDRLRDSTEFANFKGDKGLNESMLVELDNGQVLVSCGQAPGHRAFLRLDPLWLFQNVRSDDFSSGLDGWSRQKLLHRPPVYDRLFHHNYNRKPGALLVPHPSEVEKRVLHIRKPLDHQVFSQRDGAVWNFPAGRTGSIEIELMLNEGGQGVIIALNDRWYQPADSQGERSAMVSLHIPADGKISEHIQLKSSEWYTVRLKWRAVEQLESGSCELTVDGIEAVQAIPLLKASHNGLSYLRLRSPAIRPDASGVYVASVRARVELDR